MLTTPQSSALFANATMGIAVVDTLGSIEDINPFALHLFKFPAGELIGKPLEVLIPEWNHHKHIQLWDTYIHGPVKRVRAEMDLYASKKDRAKFPVGLSLGSYQMDDDNHIIAFINDISIRKKAEKEVKKLNDELEATVEQRTRDLTETLHQLRISKDKLRLSNDLLSDVLSYQKALLDNAGVMIIATDENGIIKLFNPEAVANTGYDASEVIDKKTTLLFHDKAEIDRKRKELNDRTNTHPPTDFDMLVKKAKQGIHNEEEYAFTRKDGTSFPVSLTISAITDKKGILSGFMNVAVDISERKKAEEDLQKALKKEKDLNELKSRFVSIASHEFRTWLSTVLSSAYLIQKYTTLDDQPKRDKHLQRIISSVNILTDILNDFLSLGRIEEGKIQVRFLEFNIRENISVVAEELKLLLKKGQQIQYCHDGDPGVVLDGSLLKHIITNLVSNAVKFSPEGSCIEINTVCKNSHIILSVKDHGIGISREDQKHLMERFFRAANAGNIPGNGLGLHIVSKYAELMNGMVECKSELKEGTEFTISFNAKNF